MESYTEHAELSRLLEDAPVRQNAICRAYRDWQAEVVSDATKQILEAVEQYNESGYYRTVRRIVSDLVSTIEYACERVPYREVK